VGRCRQTSHALIVRQWEVVGENSCGWVQTCVGGSRQTLHACLEWRKTMMDVNGCGKVQANPPHSHRKVDSDCGCGWVQTNPLRLFSNAESHDGHKWAWLGPGDECEQVWMRPSTLVWSGGGSWVLMGVGRCSRTLHTFLQRWKALVGPDGHGQMQTNPLHLSTEREGGGGCKLPWGSPDALSVLIWGHMGCWWVLTGVGGSRQLPVLVWRGRE
jgi:hypothetical protein